MKALKSSQVPNDLLTEEKKKIGNDLNPNKETLPRDQIQTQSKHTNPTKSCSRSCLGQMILFMPKTTGFYLIQMCCTNSQSNTPPRALVSESSSHNHDHRVQDGHPVPLGDLMGKKELDTQSIEYTVVEPKLTQCRKLIRGQKLTGNRPSEVDAKMLSHSRPKELSSPTRSKGVIVTKSTRRECRHQVDRKGIIVTKSTNACHTVDPKGLSSPSREEVVTQSTTGGLPSPSRQKVVTWSTERVAVTKSTKRGSRHQAETRS